MHSRLRPLQLGQILRVSCLQSWYPTKQLRLVSEREWRSGGSILYEGLLGICLQFARWWVRIDICAKLQVNSRSLRLSRPKMMLLKVEMLVACDEWWIKDVVDTMIYPGIKTIERCENQPNLTRRVSIGMQYMREGESVVSCLPWHLTVLRQPRGLARNARCWHFL